MESKFGFQLSQYKGINANYHTHTTRCKHASGEDREYVETAISYGLHDFGTALF